MSVRSVLQGDIPDLRQHTNPVTVFDDQLRSLIQDLVDTLVAHNGIGISATQIGAYERVCVVDIGHGPVTLVNPQLVEEQGEQESVESCLSFPGLTLAVPRPAHITVNACDAQGTPFELQADGLLARVLCHEIDHLNGALFMDLLTDEEIFQQMLMQLGDVAGSELGEDIERTAQQEEYQHILNILADAGWKLTLAAEWLQDYVDDLPELNIHTLQKLSEDVNSLFGAWEPLLTKQPTSSNDDELI